MLFSQNICKKFKFFNPSFVKFDAMIPCYEVSLQKKPKHLKLSNAAKKIVLWGVNNYPQ